MSTEASQLAGLRVLLVEDETLVAMLLSEMLQDLGCEVVGPARRVADALALTEAERVDAALLDVNLAGETVFPVADRLAARQVPFVFSTGYGPSGVDQRYASYIVLQKPYELEQLAAALTASLT